jgi:hypothetical protein
MVKTLRVKVSVFIMFWFVRVNKREGVARKNGINGGNDFLEMKGNSRNLRVTLSLSLQGNAILVYPFHDENLKIGRFFMKWVMRIHKMK